MTTKSSPDRRTRKRLEKRRMLLDIAADVWHEGGADALTMAAIGERADLTPPALYTYFPSKSALVAALQREALEVLGQVAREAVARWTVESVASMFGDAGHPLAVREHAIALGRLVAFADQVLDAPTRYPREFGLQQQLLVNRGIENLDDAADVLPVAMAVLRIPADLLDLAVAAGAIEAVDRPLDDGAVDGSPVRAVRWLAALNGVLLTGSLVVGAPAEPAAQGRRLTLEWLRGLGAAPAELEVALTLADHWRSP